MRGGEAQARRGLLVRRAGLEAKALQPLQQVIDRRVKALASLGQRYRVCAAIKQINTDPFLQRFDVPPECRLGDGADLRRARKIAALGQGQKVFQPFKIKCSVAGAHTGAATARCPAQEIIS